MKLLYFAWVRVKMGISSEYVEPPISVENVQALIEWLRQRDKVSDEIFSDLSAIKVAVNQEYVDFEFQIKMGDEVAFFPPVTGG